MIRPQDGLLSLGKFRLVPDFNILFYLGHFFSKLNIPILPSQLYMGLYQPVIHGAIPASYTWGYTSQLYMGLLLLLLD